MTLPLVKDDFLVGWMHLYVFIIRNVSLPILLCSAGSEVLAVELLNVLQSRYFKTASTLTVVVTVFSIVPYMIVQYRRVTRSRAAESTV